MAFTERIAAASIVVLISAAFLVLPHSIHAEDVPPTDPIARAEVLLGEYPAEDEEHWHWKSQRSLGRVLSYIKEPPPRVPNTAIITRFKRLFEQADLSPRERIEAFVAMARWQRSAGMNNESMDSVRSALSAAHQLYPPEVKLPEHPSSNLADGIAKLLIQWEGETDEIISAIDLSLRVNSQLSSGVGWSPPPNYAFLAAQEKRHDLVDKLVGQARHPRDSAMALAQATMGYEKVSDTENAVATARRSLAILEQMSTDDLPKAGSLDDWRIPFAESLSRLNERELAREVMANIEKGVDLSKDQLWFATVWLRIGEDGEANRRIDQYIADAIESVVDPDKKRELLHRTWWMVLMAYVERGDFALAEEMIQRFPKTSPARLNALNWIGRGLLEIGDDQSKQKACDIYRRHVSIIEKVEIPVSTRPNADLNELYYAAHQAARAGAIDVVEEHFWPKMTDHQRNRVLAFLVLYSTEMPLDERIRRYITPLTDPSLRAKYLGSIAGSYDDDQVIRHLEEMVLKETQCPAWEMGRYLRWLTSHRQSLGHWDRAREMSQHTLAAAIQADNPNHRVQLIGEAMILAWVSGYDEVARDGAEAIIDVLWEAHLQQTEEFSSEDFQKYARIAKGVLEETKFATPDLSPK